MTVGGIGGYSYKVVAVLPAVSMDISEDGSDAESDASLLRVAMMRSFIGLGTH